MPIEHLTQFIYQRNLVSLTTSKLIAEHFEHLTLAKNEFLLKAGNIPNSYFYLEQGYLRAFAEDTGGNEVTTNFYRSGQVVFEVASFFSRTPSSESIQFLIVGCRRSSYRWCCYLTLLLSDNFSPKN